MTIEIIITGVIVVTAAYVLYKNIKKKSSGSCGCGNCASKHSTK